MRRLALLALVGVTAGFLVVTSTGRGPLPEDARSIGVAPDTESAPAHPTREDLLPRTARETVNDPAQVLADLQPGEAVPAALVPTLPAVAKAPVVVQEAALRKRGTSTWLSIPRQRQVSPIKTSPVRRGSMVIPHGISAVGWMATSSTPLSKRGVVVMAGHKDTNGGRTRGPLYDLARLRRGHAVMVRWKGRWVTYRVTRVTSARRSALPPRIMSRSGRNRLALISCTGPLVKGKDGQLHWSRNVVVEAKRVSIR